MRRTLLALASTSVLIPLLAHAKSTGITGYSGNPATNGGQICNKCHDGGLSPTVTLSGPAKVTTGSRSNFTLSVSGGQQVAAGLDVSATLGQLISTMPSTYVSSGEVTHSAPQSADAQGNLTFTFDWVAPAAAGTAVLYAASNSVNLNGRTSGDLANNTNFAVLVEAPAAGLAPIAEVNGPYAGVAGSAVQLSSAGSYDPDGSIVAYTWDFGDGATSTGANPLHTYSAAGSFVVTLQVTDNTGMTGSEQTVADIAPSPTNQPPVAVANGPYSGVVRKSVQFSSAGSYDPDGTISSYLWNFGDGATSAQANPTHTYKRIGSYGVTLTVKDNGGVSSSAGTTATITR
ncbi:MAG: PKD domain-containing protein [Myxococcales bacterium]|nr:PKD domain-containing protein [Myxococcales bacterium]